MELQPIGKDACGTPDHGQNIQEEEGSQGSNSVSNELSADQIDVDIVEQGHLENPPQAEEEIDEDSNEIEEDLNNNDSEEEFEELNVDEDQEMGDINLPNAEHDSPVHEANRQPQGAEPNPVGQEERPDDWFRYTCKIIFNATFWHWIITLSTAIFMVVSLYFHPWRDIRVKREMLIDHVQRGNLDPAVMNSTIAFSRRQGMIRECFFESADIYTHFDTNYSLTTMRGCHDVLSKTNESGLSPAVLDNHRSIIGLTRAISIFGSLLLGVVVIEIVFHFLCVIFGGSKAILYLSNAIIRVINAFLCWILFIVSIQLDSHFEKKNPGFPVSWPVEIQLASDVILWREGHIEWILAMTLHLVAICFDLRHVPTG